MQEKEKNSRLLQVLGARQMEVWSHQLREEKWFEE